MDSDLFRRMAKLVDGVVYSFKEIEVGSTNYSGCNMCLGWLKTGTVADHSDDCPYVIALALRQQGNLRQ